MLQNALIVFAAHVVVWHLCAALFAWLDATRLLWKYKIVQEDTVSYWTCLPVVLFNQFCVLLPIVAVGGWLDLAFNEVQVPWYLFPVHAYLMGVVHDVVFYFGHKALHWPALFRFHQLHHQSSGAVAASSLYMSPLDFFVEIILPYGVFLCLIRTDLRFDVLLASLGSLLAMYEHSGYCFTTVRAFDSRMHISHHVGRLNGSFSEGVGSPGYMDLLFGTHLKDFSRFVIAAVQ